MKRLAVLIMMLGLGSAPALAADGLWITKIVEAGVGGCDDNGDGYETRILKFVTKTCAGQERCQLVLKNAAASRGCSSFFVIYKCSDGSSHEASTENMSKNLKLQCE